MGKAQVLLVTLTIASFCRSMVKSQTKHVHETEAAMRVIHFITYLLYSCRLLLGLVTSCYSPSPNISLRTNLIGGKENLCDSTDPFTDWFYFDFL